MSWSVTKRVESPVAVALIRYWLQSRTDLFTSKSVKSWVEKWSGVAFNPHAPKVHLVVLMSLKDKGVIERISQGVYRFHPERIYNHSPGDDEFIVDGTWAKR